MKKEDYINLSEIKGSALAYMAEELERWEK